MLLFPQQGLFLRQPADGRGVKNDFRPPVSYTHLTCYGDACQINGLIQEELKNLSYDPPRNELLSEAQDKKEQQKQ